MCHGANMLSLFEVIKHVAATIARGFFRGKARDRRQATLLLARRAPTMERWSLDARSEGGFAYPLLEEKKAKVC